VLDGVGPTTQLGAQDGVVVFYQGSDYLITGNKSYRIGPGAQEAYDLKDAVVNAPTIADSVFALIPPGNAKGLSKLSLQGTASKSSSGQSSSDAANIGEVVRVDRPGQGEQFYVILQGGLALVSMPVAKLLRLGRGEDISQPAPELTVDQVNAYPRNAPLGGLDSYPSYAPRILRSPVLCWQWNSKGTNPTLTLANSVPAPQGQPRSQLAKPDGAGPGLDEVSLPSGLAINASAVPGAHSGAPQGYWLVSPNGVGYPIADKESAQALGLSDPILVPVDALSALAQGPPLSLTDAERTVDVFRENPATGSG
jgi:Type VII secretion system ESX-1, transport TM domain B